jgi:hypothetical protein
VGTRTEIVQMHGARDRGVARSSGGHKGDLVELPCHVSLLIHFTCSTTTMSLRRKGSFSRIFKKEKSSQSPDAFIISEPKNFREGVHVTFDPNSQNFKVSY